ncbi:MAG: phosphonate ABC transporter, permease protein PhnE [Geminicoccaceae bacterium]|nr:MAG: phosphonate ABC transporter, permease protein PhnE [Geminicoccaceae bacterium]
MSSDAVRLFETRRAEQIAARRRQTALFGVVFLAAFAVSVVVGEVSLERLATGLPRFFAYIERTLPTLSLATLGADLGRWFWNFEGWLRLLFDTILIAFVATTLGVIGGFLLSFAAAKNLVANPWIHHGARRFLELMRTVPELVFALFFVFAFGLGPMAGVLAIALHTLGVLGKLFAEINENVTAKSLDGVVAAGASFDQVIRFGVVPQVLPGFVSYTLLRFEINVRSASVIGFVGAGGIGQELMFVINQFIYTDISAILLMLIVTVALIDLGCEKLRHRLIGQESLK